MGITVIPNLLQENSEYVPAGPKTLGEIALDGKYYRHPDSALISYPLVVEKPLGTIDEKPKLKIAIVGGGAAGIAALYELSKLKNSSNNIHLTLYESDPEHCVFLPETLSVSTAGLRAGRVSTAVSSDNAGNDGHIVYELGAMRFPEIAGLMWHYVSILYSADTKINVFPNPGRVPTELIHGHRVDRFVNDQWLDKDSPTRHVRDVVREGLFGRKDGANTSLFLIDGEDPAKISDKLKNEKTKKEQLEKINKEWKVFVNECDKLTLESAVRKVIQNRLDVLPEVPGLPNDADKTNYYVELFGTVGFGTGGCKSVYNMSLTEMMRLLLWDYSNEYTLPVQSNVQFIKGLYLKALKNNPNIEMKLARVNDVCHLDENPNGHTMVVYYEKCKDGSEGCKPKKDVYDYIILSATPRQTSAMISKIGFDNVPRKVTLGDYERPLLPENYDGYVRPPLILKNEFEATNSKIYSAVNNIHMVSSSRVFATIKKSDFEKYAPEFPKGEKIKVILSDCGLGSSYVVPSTVLNNADAEKFKDYYSFLISYCWEDDAKKMQHHFGKYPLNIDDTKRMMNAVINRTIRCVRDPVDQTIKPWWFGEALSKCKLEDALSYDWATFNSSGAFKLDNTGDHYNSNLLFRYHTHAMNPELKNRFFLANDSYSHLGGWLEGAFMSAVNAVCGLIVAANDGNVNALSPEARKVVQSLDSVVEK